MLESPALDAPASAGQKGNVLSAAEKSGTAAPAPAERKSDAYVSRDKRLVTMLLLARLETAAGDGLTRIRNVSAGGGHGRNQPFPDHW